MMKYKQNIGYKKIQVSEANFSLPLPYDILFKSQFEVLSAVGTVETRLTVIVNRAFLYSKCNGSVFIFKWKILAEVQIEHFTCKQSITSMQIH